MFKRYLNSNPRELYYNQRDRIMKYNITHAPIQTLHSQYWYLLVEFSAE